MKHRSWLGLGVASLVLGVLWFSRSGWPDHEGALRQVVSMSAWELRRGGVGHVELLSVAMYTPSGSDELMQHAFSDWKSSQLSLVAADGKATPVGLAKDSRWSDDDGPRRARVQLPEVPDGDYKLHLVYETTLGKGELDLPLALYAPARIHVITDRPLYEPGNLVKFRAVVVRARDLTPIDGRPGRWIVTNPAGEVLLEEAAPAGEFGVVAGSFPLDSRADVGTWKVKWESGQASAEADVRVEPFTLPRFRVDAETARPFYRAGERPVITGAVHYSSGAPVARAELAVSWALEGEWQPPTEWLEDALPEHGSTGLDGRFELTLPKIPDDLRGQVRATARIVATDATKDRVQTSTTVLMSEDAIQASVVTELGDRLAQGFNNRLYVRVSTADGRVLPNAAIRVMRSWQPSDPGIEAQLDEDGVASLQIDPGPPSNIVIPPMPWRAPARQPQVRRGVPQELFRGAGAPLVDQVEIDRWLEPLAACAKWAGISSTARVGLRVAASGSFTAVTAGAGPLERCVSGILRSRRLPAGEERMYALTFELEGSELSSLAASIESVASAPPGLQEALDELAAGARDCLPRDVEGALPRMLTWRSTAGQRAVQLAWSDDPLAGQAGGAEQCVTSRIGAPIQLAEKASDDVLGVVRFRVALPAHVQAARPQATTRLAYQFTIRADVEGKPTTKVIVEPGTIPDLRLRVSPVLADGR
ncbi:MAG: MG2 domain-containing protein [Myxococcales bacterium]